MRWNSQSLAKSWGRGCPLRLEELADRVVPSVTTTFDDGVLKIEGDEGNEG